jgi:glycosyltransferase involved in cell wall biosynthesis
MARKKTKASIIVRAYNEEEHIGKLMKRLFNQKINSEFEVVVVDSGSTDGTLEIVKKYPVNLVHIKPGSFSFGRSLNLGIEKSNGKYSVFISAHCYPKRSDWLENMISPMIKNKNIALVFGKQRGDKTTKFSEHQIFHKLYPDDDAGIRDVPFCNNANSAIRKSVWKKIRYDESLTGLEDVWWANQVIKKGYKIYYQPEAGIIHIHQESPRKIFNRYKREAIALRKIFPDTKFSFLDFLRLFIHNTIMDIVSLVGWRKGLSSIWEIIGFRLMQYWGTYKGINFSGKVSENMKRIFYYPRGRNSASTMI